MGPGVPASEPQGPRPSEWPCEKEIFSGAGGNRTPVHQPVNEPATTIPDIESHAVSPAGQLVTLRWPSLSLS